MLKRAVNLSLSADVVAKARDRGLNLSELAEQAIRKEIARLAHADVQARMDRTSAFWNAYHEQGPTPADEYSVL